MGDPGDLSKPTLAISVDLFQDKINCKKVSMTYDSLS